MITSVGDGVGFPVGPGVPVGVVEVFGLGGRVQLHDGTGAGVGTGGLGVRLAPGVERGEPVVICLVAVADGVVCVSPAGDGPR
ncbi:MAG: hypothetical protein HOV79_15140, partial [Hamadaea sp.]|nr:hypothetical protein [Hamadaea sp.]